MILIGIAGLARSGKDTAAAYLAKELGLYQYAFAEPLKTMLKSVFGDHFHYGDRSGICPEAGVSYRHLMQTLGTEWGRQQVNPDLWVNLVDRYWRALQSAIQNADIFQHAAVNVPKGLILSDLRFNSEAKWIKENGGKVIHITRPDILHLGEHASEQGIDYKLIDISLDNDGDLLDFNYQLDEACKILGILPWQPQ